MRDLVEPRHGRRRVDGVHHVVERDGQRVDVLAVERRDERAVQPVDDGARPAVAAVLDVLDGSALAMSGGSLGSICLSSSRAAADLLGEADEVVEEVLLARDQTENGPCHLVMGVGEAITRMRACNEDVTES